MALKLIIIQLQIFRNYAHVHTKHTTYCNPKSRSLSNVCPNGQLCQRHVLHCKTTKNGVMYCICPNYYYSDDYYSHEHSPHSSHESEVVIQVSHDDNEFSHHREYADEFPHEHILPHHDYSHEHRPHSSHESEVVIQVSHDDNELSHHREYADEFPHQHILPHHDVHCDPFSHQVCPNGLLCDPEILDCTEDDNGGPVYCICHGFSHHRYHRYHRHRPHILTHHDYSHDPEVVIQVSHDDDVDEFPHQHILSHDHDVHCDPFSFQVCPNGLLCDPEILDCTEDDNGGPVYCICPGHGFSHRGRHRHRRVLPRHHDVHCDPFSHQVCPNGVLCDPEILDCTEDDEGLMYCLCSGHGFSHHPHHSQEHVEVIVN